MGILAPTEGIVGFSVDGGAETDLRLYASRVERYSILFSTPQLPPGVHTIKMKVNGLKESPQQGMLWCLESSKSSTSQTTRTLQTACRALAADSVPSLSRGRLHIVELDSVPATANTKESVTMTCVLNRCKLNPVKSRGDTLPVHH